MEYRDIVTTPDGRRVAVEITGNKDGFPVFLLHGSPGSKVGPKPLPIRVYRRGVRLICYDRPGYGESDRHTGRSVADAARDIEAIADKLDLEHFGVVGRSGGGPHALACAAILGHRVVGVSVLVGIAPAGAADLDWFKGMSAENVAEYEAADSDLAELTKRLEERATEAMRDPDSMVEFLKPQMAQADKNVVDDVTIRRMLHEAYQDALRHGAAGWIDDALAFRKPWNFDLAAITCPVLIWHGIDDTFSPVSHARWLQARLPHAAVRVQLEPGAAHFSAMEVFPRVLSWHVSVALAAGVPVATPGTPPSVRMGVAQ